MIGRLMRIVREGVLATLCAMVWPTVGIAEGGRIGNASVAELRTLFERAAAATGTVGAQVSAIFGDQRIDFVYGTANAELSTPMTVDTVVQIGSTTKLLNAAVVMTLVDEGRMAIDTPITQYLPQLRLAGRRAADDVTLRRLLSMSAGLDMGPTKSFRGDDALGQFVTALSDIPLNYPTGHGFGYSNASVCVSAHAAERVAGQPWDTLLKKRVLEPAGITHFVNLAEDLAFQRVAVGHSLVKQGQSVSLMRPWIADQGAAPAGLSVAISAHDLALFGQLFLNGGKATNGNRVLSEAAVNSMMTSTTKLAIGAPQWGVGDEWGLGPTTAQWGKTVVWGHGGSNMGGSSQLLWFPAKRAVLAFTMNSPMAFEPFSIRMTGDFAQALLGVRAPAAARADRPVRVDHPERLVGTYVRYGVRYEITASKGKLHYQEFNEFLSATYKEMKIDSASSGPLVDTDLVALGDDRFLVSFPGFENGIPVFFYGKDEKGRATNITSGLRTGGRKNLADTASTRDIHERMLVLDTHLDTPIHFGRPGWSMMDRHTFDQDLSQVDYPRMVEGGLDGGFFVISSGQGPLTPEGYAAARDFALHRAFQIREMVAGSGGHFVLANTPSDAQRIAADGDRVVFQSIENSYPLGEDLTLLRTFHQLGVRLLGVVHTKNNQFADSATDEPRWNGLSPLGRKLVEEANRLGMVLDASHASDAALDQMLDRSRTPIILSHSSLKAIVDHPRNLDDARLRRLAANGGVIQMLAYSSYLVSTPKIPKVDAASAYYEKLPVMSSRDATALAARLRDLKIKHQVPQATFETFMKSLRYAIEVAGIDYVGLGIDWDGGAGVQGLTDAADLPRITAGLLKAGYSPSDVTKVMGGNTLRVLQQAEGAAAQAQAHEDL